MSHSCNDSWHQNMADFVAREIVGFNEISKNNAVGWFSECQKNVKTYKILN